MLVEDDDELHLVRTVPGGDSFGPRGDFVNLANSYAMKGLVFIPYTIRLAWKLSPGTAARRNEVAASAGVGLAIVVVAAAAFPYAIMYTDISSLVWLSAFFAVVLLDLGYIMFSSGKESQRAFENEAG